MIFFVNGVLWAIRFVRSDSPTLRRSDGSITVGCTDANKHCVYLSELLQGDFLRKVLTHELVHVSCFSYGYQIDIETEEIIADFLATYGGEILTVCEDILNRIGGVYANRRAL